MLVNPSSYLTNPLTWPLPKVERFFASCYRAEGDAPAIPDVVPVCKGDKDEHSANRIDRREKNRNILKEARHQSLI